MLMDNFENERPLLEQSDCSDNEFQNEISEGHDDVPNHVIVSYDAGSLLKAQYEPNDKYNLSYLIFYLLGMTTLLPWNFFITAEDYWMYKFRDTNNNATDHRTPLQAGFTSDLTVASSIPNTVFLVLNTFLSNRISLQFRMIGSLVAIIVFFVASTALVGVNTDHYQEMFFIFTIASVVFMNIASAIFSGGLLGIVGKFSPCYITAVVSGQALGGIFAALCEIISLTFGVSATLSAFVYFMVGNVVLILSLVAYIVLSRAVFFKYHLDRIGINSAHGDVIKYAISYKHILKKIWIYGFSEALVFVTTLAVYPGITVLIDSEHKGNGNPWNDVYFVPVVSYLIFNIGDYVGRIIAGMWQRPRNKAWIVGLLSVSRIAFIPLLMMCNAHPRNYLPIIIHSDIAYIGLVVIFALTNGYIANIALINAPKVVDQHERETASSMMAAFIGLGLALGSGLCLLMVKLL